MSIFTVAKALYGAGQAIAAGSMAAMSSSAFGLTMLIKKSVDEESDKVLEQVKKGERCVKIEKIECTWGVPSAYAVSHVADNGGISWRIAEKNQSLVFWHPDETFRPCRCDNPLVKSKITGKVGKADYSGPSNICQNTSDCCRKSRV